MCILDSSDYGTALLESEINCLMPFLVHCFHAMDFFLY